MLQDISLGENVKIKVIPRSKKTEIIGVMDDGSLKIRLAAVPENGKANEVLLAFLSGEYGGKWEVVSGVTNTRKIVRKIGVTEKKSPRKGR